MSTALQRVLTAEGPIDWKMVQRVVKRQKSFGVLCQSLDQILTLTGQQDIPNSALVTLLDRLEEFEVWADQAYLYHFRMWKYFLVKQPRSDPHTIHDLHPDNAASVDSNTVSANRLNELIEILTLYYEQADDPSTGPADIDSILLNFPRWKHLLEQSYLLHGRWKTLILFTSRLPYLRNHLNEQDDRWGSSYQRGSLLSMADFPVPNIVVLLWALKDPTALSTNRDSKGGSALHLAAMMVGIWGCVNVYEKNIPLDLMQFQFENDDSLPTSGNLASHQRTIHDHTRRHINRILEALKESTPIATLLAINPDTAKSTNCFGHLPLETLLITCLRMDSENRIVKNRRAPRFDRPRQSPHAVLKDLQRLIQAAPRALVRRNPHPLCEDGAHLIPCMIPAIKPPSESDDDEAGDRRPRRRIQKDNPGLLSLTYELLRANPTVVTLWRDKEVEIAAETPFEERLRSRLTTTRKEVKALEDEQVALQQEIQALEEEQKQLHEMSQADRAAKKQKCV